MKHPLDVDWPGFDPWFYRSLTDVAIISVIETETGVDQVCVTELRKFDLLSTSQWSVISDR